VSIIATKLKKLKRLELASLAFYAVSGILLLAALPFSAYAPHLAFLGIISLITAYSLLTKRAWAPWLVAVLLIVNSVFAFYTLGSVGFSNILVALSMIGLAVLTWLASIYLLVMKNRS
jgi:hypothetical protein